MNTKRNAKKLTHVAYIWERGNKSPSVVDIKLVSGSFDSKVMEGFLKNF